MGEQKCSTFCTNCETLRILAVTYDCEDAKAEEARQILKKTFKIGCGMVPIGGDDVTTEEINVTKAACFMSAASVSELIKKVREAKIIQE